MLTLRRSFWETLWSFLLIVSGFVSIYAILQFYEYDLFNWGRFPWSLPLRRICASFANPNFLGGYLALSIPLTLAALLSRRRLGGRKIALTCLSIQILLMVSCLIRGGSPSIEKFVSKFRGEITPILRTLLILLQTGYFLAPILPFLIVRKWRSSGLYPVFLILWVQFTALVFTFSAGGIAAVILGGFLMGVFWAISRSPDQGKRKFPLKTWAVLIGIALIVLILVFIGNHYLSGADRKTKIVYRWETYKATIEMIASRPWFGFGPGMYSHYFPEYRPENLALYRSLGEYYVLHGHNEYLEIASELGIIGLGLYLWVILSVLWPSTVQTWRRPRNDTWWLRTALLAALFSTLAHNLVSVNLRQVSVVCLFWLFLGWLTGLELSSQFKSHRRMDSRFRWTKLPVLILVPLIFLNSVYVLKNYMGDLFLVRALMAHEDLEYRQAKNNYKPAISLLQNPARAYYFRGGLEYRFGAFEKALQDFQKVVELENNFADVYFNLGTCSAKMGLDQKALKYFEEGLKMNPKNPKLQDYYARTLIFSGRNEEGQAERKRAIQLYREAIIAHRWDAEFYHGLGKNLMFEERWEEALENLRRAKELEPENRLYQQGLIEFKQYRAFRSKP